MKRLLKSCLQASLLLGVCCWQAKAQFGGGPFGGLKNYSKSATIGIDTPGTGGSGVVIGKTGNTYYFLTAAHVASGDPTKEEFWAYSPTGDGFKKYKITRLWQPKEFAGKDIAIGSFSSPDKIEVALIFPIDTKQFASEDAYKIYGSLNGREFDKEWQIQGPPIVAGISLPTGAITIPLFRFTVAEMQSRATGNQKGFEAVYAATSTVAGMSGGGVFGARGCPSFSYNNRTSWGAYPGLIAIHGMSEGYGDNQGRSGVSLGIPLDLVASYLGNNAKSLGIPIGKDYYNRVVELCINRGMY